MPAIHLIERLGNVHRIDKDKNEWESGYWVVSEDAAQKLIGGDIYLHEGQNDPSHFGGRLLGYRVHRGGELDGRVIFLFNASVKHKGIRTGKGGWGNEKKIVWQSEGR
jgi:hypothetical protein